MSSNKLPNELPNELSNKLSLISLSDVINDMNKDNFSFDDFRYELAKVEYDNKTKYESVMRVNEWIESVPYHTFPKTKYRWINAITAQPDLRNIAVNYKLNEIVTNVYLKEQIPGYVLNFYNSIFNSPNIDKSAIIKEKSILCKLNAIQVFDNLIELELIRIDGKRVYINRYKLERKVLSTSQTKRTYDISEDDDCIMTYKKQRYS